MVEVIYFSIERENDFFFIYAPRMDGCDPHFICNFDVFKNLWKYAPFQILTSVLDRKLQTRHFMLISYTQLTKRQCGSTSLRNTATNEVIVAKDCYNQKLELLSVLTSCSQLFPYSHFQDAQVHVLSIADTRFQELSSQLVPLF